MLAVLKDADRVYRTLSLCIMVPAVVRPTSMPYVGYEAMTALGSFPLRMSVSD